MSEFEGICKVLIYGVSQHYRKNQSFGEKVHPYNSIKINTGRYHLINDLHYILIVLLCT